MISFNSYKNFSHDSLAASLFHSVLLWIFNMKLKYQIIKIVIPLVMQELLLYHSRKKEIRKI